VLAVRWGHGQFGLATIDSGRPLSSKSEEHTEGKASASGVYLGLRFAVLQVTTRVYRDQNQCHPPSLTGSLIKIMS